ncbi:unnamed protein product [Brassicogethes aeneus]|uniref:Box C/D snoRNA protein 1 n=1 Tax=Brassicogethes aeneus TaxID=1431903 RepID=A0A9P0FEF2_BRAAE|nr:unnamed protein product [Brassicogethes aeneus]
MEVDKKPIHIKFDSDQNTNIDKSRLGDCEVCGFHDAKYTCPRCEVKTCSLRCNKIHKLEVECNGERDRAKFIPLKKFTNMDLSSDLRLLEEISKNLETSKKKIGRNIKFPKLIPPRLIKLKDASTARRVNLKFLPNEFARHKRNSTKFNINQNTISWHIDWIFGNANNLKITDRMVPEDQKLSSIINKFLLKQDNENLQNSLKFYQSAGLPGINLYLKAEQKAGGKKFYELDVTMTLKECLHKKIIIEYPTIYVVLKGHEGLYEVLDSDEEAEEQMETEEIKSGQEIVNTIINNAEDEDSFYRSLKNLLFVSEYSDDELSEDE